MGPLLLLLASLSFDLAMPCMGQCFPTDTRHQSCGYHGYQPGGLNYGSSYRPYYPDFFESYTYYLLLWTNLLAGERNLLSSESKMGRRWASPLS